MPADIACVAPASRIATIFWRQCSWCKRITGFTAERWQGKALEITHTICPDCLDEQYPQDPSCDDCGGPTDWDWDSESFLCETLCTHGEAN